MNKKKIFRVMMVCGVGCLLAAVCFVGCTKKRCICTTERYGFQPARGIEDLGGHANCSELDEERVADDSTMQYLYKKCVPEVQ